MSLSTRTPRLFLLAERPICARCMYRASTPRKVVGGQRWSSTQAGSVPLLSKIKEDLKAAMRAKDTARLNVLRGTISEINQAASSSNPIKSDAQILALLRKRKSSTEQAIKEAAEAQRNDLVEKQEKEISVIEELTSAVKMLDPAEMRDAVRSVVEALRSSGTALKPGVVMKELLKAGGVLEGKLLDNKVLSEIVKEEVVQS